MLHITQKFIQIESRALITGLTDQIDALPK